jgi:hypothetical protein
MYANLNAWREILARIFMGFAEQDNVSPAWLVNPATRRRLKLDKYYPDAGVAIRFVGLLAKGQGRQSDREVQETEQRDQTRDELCRLNGVQLVLIDSEEEVLKQIDGLLRTLTRASRTLAQSDQPARYKQQWMPLLSKARDVASQLRTLIAKNPEQMVNNLAESWRDREVSFGQHDRDPITPLPPASTTTAAIAYAVGQRVHHERFGDGVITEVVNTETDATLTILFDGAQPRTFSAALVQSKLTPA